MDRAAGRRGRVVDGVARGLPGGRLRAADPVRDAERRRAAADRGGQGGAAGRTDVAGRSGGGGAAAGGGADADAAGVRVAAGTADLGADEPGVRRGPRRLRRAGAGQPVVPAVVGSEPAGPLLTPPPFGNPMY